jgi:uncharacterized protein (TIGR03067 family)
MIKFTWLLVLWAMLGISHAEEPAANELKKLQGLWAPQTMTLGGNDLPEEIRKMITLEIKDKNYIVKAGGQNDEGTLTISTSAKPLTMEITGTNGPNKGKTYRAIYKLDGDTLTICYDLAGKEYPKDFTSTKKSMQFLVVYQRSK